MLKTRFFTALAMVAVGLVLLFALPPLYFMPASAVLLLGVGGREAGRGGEAERRAEGCEGSEGEAHGWISLSVAVFPRRSSLAP